MSPISRGILPDQSFVPFAYRFLDTAAIGFILSLALRRTPGATAEEMVTIAAVAALVHLVVSELSGLYRSWRSSRIYGEFGCVLITWAYTSGILLGIGLVTRLNARYAYESKLIWLFAAPWAMIALRYAVRIILRNLRARGLNSHRYAICGINSLGIQLARNIEHAPELGLRFVGFCDDRPSERTEKLPRDVGRFLGDIDELVRQSRRGQVDTVYITFPMRAEERIRSVLSRLGDTTASVYIVPDFFVFELLHARWTNVNGLPAVSVFENPLYGVDGLAKRCADLVFGFLCLLISSIPMLFIALAVKMTSPGPVFFRQKRYGLDGREILVWKFRSMRCCENGESIRQATKNDQRVTPVGAFLRRTSLDELPQLFNVLEGTMSLVGPRPHATAHNEQYRQLINGYMLRHKVKPGITGLAQVSGYRGETQSLEKMQKRIACDHQYIREWSFGTDLKILLRTVLVVLRQQNAY